MRKLVVVGEWVIFGVGVMFFDVVDGFFVVVVRISSVVVGICFFSFVVVGSFSGVRLMFWFVFCVRLCVFFFRDFFYGFLIRVVNCVIGVKCCVGIWVFGDVLL